MRTRRWLLEVPYLANDIRYIIYRIGSAVIPAYHQILFILYTVLGPFGETLEISGNFFSLFDTLLQPTCRTGPGKHRWGAWVDCGQPWLCYPAPPPHTWLGSCVGVASLVESKKCRLRVVFVHTVVYTVKVCDYLMFSVQSISYLTQKYISY